jgi:hypothetical protein
MAENGVGECALTLSGMELIAVKAAIATGIEELERAQAGNGEDYARLLVMRRRTSGLTGDGSCVLALDRREVELLLSCVTEMMALHGYVVGKPEAIVALTSVRQRLQRQSSGGRWARLRRAAGEILYGMALHDSTRMFRKQQANVEHLFVLVSFGDLLGVPIMPPYYTLRLLPFVVPLINGWRRRMLREKDLLDAIF